jgi:hypothetical protein
MNRGRKGEIVVAFNQESRRIVSAKSVIASLPKIGVGVSGQNDGMLSQFETTWRIHPFCGFQVEGHWFLGCVEQGCCCLPIRI